MRMASIQKSIKMYDDLYDILNVIVGSAAAAASTLEDLWDTVNDEMDTSPIENVRDELEKMAMEWNAFEEAVSELDVPQMVVPQIDILSMNQLVNVEVSVMANKSPTPDPQEIRPDTVPNGPPISAGMQIEWNLEESGDSEENESKKDTSKENTPKEKGPKDNTPMEVAPKENTPTENTPTKIAPKGNDSKENAPKGGNSQAANMISSSLSASITAEMDIMEGISWLVDYAVYGANANYDQARAEAQLMAAMLNNPDAAYNLQYTGESPTDAEPQALQSAFDSVVDKAHEIQGQGIYTDNTMIAGATELSSAFSDPTAIVMMMDTLADFAMGVSGGGETDGGTMAQYAGILGDARAGSYEAMAEKGLAFTEAQKAVIEGTATQEQVIAAIGKEYLNASQDIQAAAAINAVISDSWDGLYESLSNTPDGKIVQMNHAFEEINKTIGGQLCPFVMLFVDLIIDHKGTIQSILSGITQGLLVIMGVLSWLLEGALNFAQIIIDNWSWISPIIYGIAAALAVYGAYLAITKGLELASSVAAGAVAIGKGLLAAATMIATGATWKATTAQMGLNGAMYACPIVWIIILIIALIAVIFAVCNAIAKMTGVADSGLGVICGCLNVANEFFKNLGLTVADIVLGIWNAIGALTDNMKIAFNNAICSVQSKWYALLSTVLSVVADICEALNKLPFVEIDSGFINASRDVADIYAAKALEAEGNKEEFKSVSDAFNEGFHTYEIFQDGWISEAFKAGAALGDGIADLFGSFSLKDLFPTEPPPDTNDLVEQPAGGGVGVIAENTGSIKDSLACTEEDLKYLRDIAEQEAVNRYTLAEVKIEQTNHNNINSAMDLDGVVSGLTDAVNESIDSITEGVHE